MITEVRKSFRKEIFSKLEEQFQRGRTPEDDLFLLPFLRRQDRPVACPVLGNDTKLKR